MAIGNNLSYEKNKSILNINVNLTVVALVLFTFVISSMKSFFMPNIMEWFLLGISITLLIFNNLMVQRKGMTITIVELMWSIFWVYFVLNIMIHNIFDTSRAIDLYHYTIAMLLILVLKTDINNYYASFRLIKVFGLMYGFSGIFQYLFTDIYLNTIFKYFSEGERTNILQLLNENSYTGFTNQTAYIAGYLVSALGVIIFSKRKGKLLDYSINISMIVFLVIGLFLAAKRAHLIFMICAILITLLISLDKKFYLKKLNRLILGSSLISLIIFITFMKINEDSPIIMFINELKYTFIGIIQGEDVSTGRIKLYKYSWELFTSNPIFGIGWKEFISNSVGLLNIYRGSHPHNIYLQLLTELGIVGFVLFMIPVIYVYLKTFNILRSMSINNSVKFLQNWKHGLQYSFFYQTFFLLYGLTGNLLTDFNFLLMYFFVVSITISAIVSFKTRCKYQFH